jgi:hypothetical protein
MPTYATPEPISVELSLLVSDTSITASDRMDTVVEVRPADPDNELDVQAVQRTNVEFADGELSIRTPKLSSVFRTRYGSIVITVDLPAGSRVQGDTALGRLTCTGELGEVRFRTSTGDIRVEQARCPNLKTSTGRMIVDRATGHADLVGAGEMRIREINGTAVIKNVNGDIFVGDSSGDLRLKAASGNITVQRANGDVDAKTASGSIRLADVARGSVALESAAGELEIGIREGAAAWLDANSKAGRVRTELDAADGPGAAADTVQVRARTYTGDILIHRA